MARCVLVWLSHLLVQTIEQLPPREALEHQVQLGVALVHLLQPHDVGVVELDEDLNLAQKLHQHLRSFNVHQVEALGGVGKACGAVVHETDGSGDAATNHLAVVDAGVHVFDECWGCGWGGGGGGCDCGGIFVGG